MCFRSTWFSKTIGESVPGLRVVLPVLGVTDVEWAHIWMEFVMCMGLDPSAVVTLAVDW